MNDTPDSRGLQVGRPALVVDNRHCELWWRPSTGNVRPRRPGDPYRASAEKAMGSVVTIIALVPAAPCSCCVVVDSSDQEAPPPGFAPGFVCHAANLLPLDDPDCALDDETALAGYCA